MERGCGCTRLLFSLTRSVRAFGLVSAHTNQKSNAWLTLACQPLLHCLSGFLLASQMPAAKLSLKPQPRLLPPPSVTGSHCHG
eukprot:1162132-Pelagomonas_calceolata.AAC.8